MKEYSIYYIAIEDGETFNAVGSGYGHNEAEAQANFMVSHRGTCVEITGIEFYKDVKATMWSY